MKEITYKGETHTFEEWCKILQERAVCDDLQDFAKELVIEGRITNDTLYTLYTIWQGENCLPKVSFQKRIPSIFKRYRPDLKPYRTSTTRGWKVCDSNS